MKYAFLPVLLLMAGMLWAQQPLKIKFIHGFNGNPVQLDEVFSIEDGRKIKLTRAEFYLCSLNAENQDGTAGQLFDDVYRFNFSGLNSALLQQPFLVCKDFFVLYFNT